MPRYIQAPPMTPNQALFVLESALAEKKLTLSDVKRYLTGLGEEIARLEARIAQLSGAERSGGSAAAPRSEARLEVKAPKKRGGDPPFPRKKRPMKITAERAASMKLQGRYLALIRKASKKDQARFKKMAKEEGREKAIQAMEKAL